MYQENAYPVPNHHPHYGGSAYPQIDPMEIQYQELNAAVAGGFRSLGNNPDATLAPFNSKIKRSGCWEIELYNADNLTVDHFSFFIDNNLGNLVCSKNERNENVNVIKMNYPQEKTQQPYGNNYLGSEAHNANNRYQISKIIKSIYKHIGNNERLYLVSAFLVLLLTTWLKTTHEEWISALKVILMYIISM